MSTAWTKSWKSVEYIEPIWPLPVIDGYNVRKKIGSGAFGSVYEAIHLETGEVTAVKSMTLDEKEQMLPGSASKEIDNLLACRNLSSIVQFRDKVVPNGCSGSTVHIIMEHMNHSLDSVLKTTPNMFNEDTIRLIMQKLLMGIQELHQAGVVHRDIKPANILLSKNNTVVKLCDLGLAERFNPGTSPTFPRSNAPIGSPSYIAPEILGRKEYSTCVDLWSVGCVMGVMALKGERLFPGPDASDQLWQICNLVVVSPEKLQKKIRGSGLSFRGFDLLKNLLQPNPGKRISVSEALNHPWFNMKPKAKLTRPHWRP